MYKYKKETGELTYAENMSSAAGKETILRIKVTTFYKTIRNHSIC